MMQSVFNFDHIAVGCTELAEGVAWVEDQLCVKLHPGGRHVHFGTHNMLLGLGDLYLEVIAKDPAASVSARPTWFDLDRFSGPPRLANWICRTADLYVAPDITGPPVALSRGDLHWQLTVPKDGQLPFQGGYPSLLQWAKDIVPPGDSLPDIGCRLVEWIVFHPQADWLQENIPLADTRVVFQKGAPGFAATIDTPRGPVRL